MHYIAAIWIISLFLGGALTMIGAIIAIFSDFDTEIGEWIAKIGIVLMGTSAVTMCGAIIYDVLTHIS